MQTLLGTILDFINETNGTPGAPIDAEASFAALGLPSAQAVTMMSRLSTLLGRPLPPILPWEYGSPQALARHLGGLDAAAVVEGPLGVAADEPIAIIGMACRFPGAATLEAFWSLLLEGRDCVGEIPAARWPAEAFHDADNTVPDRMVTHRGSFLERVDLFDPAAFGISPREATELDPQQRLGLELTVEAAEDAGLGAAELGGREVGMFWGAMARDFGEIVQGLPIETPYRGTGTANNMIANRISYVLDTCGPSLVVDTACSSSLVALDLAVQSLRRGQCEMAFVGAVNVILSPWNMVAVSKSLGLAPDGRCKAFSAAADGPGRGEGAGVVLLKPLSRALRDGDRVYACVRATAVNNDGRSNGLTAPNGVAQERVLRRAWQQAGTAAQEVDYVEAHGTGTPLGDPIEIAALGRVLGAGRTEDAPLRVGSVKSNLAHLEAAAGMAGLIKTVLMQHQRMLVPSIHSDQLNPLIDFRGAGVEVVRQARPWPGKPGRAVYAGVSSFGWGGTNAHAVLEGPPLEPRFVPVAADSEAELMQALAALAEGSAPLPACAGAAWGPWRAGLAVRDRAEVRRLLSLHAGGKRRPQLHISAAPEASEGLVLMCGPAGGQWPGMGRQLFARDAVFRAALKQAGAAIERAGGADVVAELLGGADPARFETVEFMVPAVFALQVAQHALLRSWGLRVGAAVGYSIGEIAAAHLAGQLDLDSAAAVAVAYGQAAAQIAGQGGLLLVMAPRERVELTLRADGVSLHVAGEPSQASVMLAGTPEGLAAAADGLRAAGILISPIRVPLAAHSPLAEPAARLLALWLPPLQPGLETVPFLSVVTGTELAPRSVDGAYFADNLRAPNHFPPVIRQMLARGHRQFVELGPQTSLVDAVHRAAAGLEGVTAVGLGRMAREDGEVVAEARAALFAAGCRPAAAQEQLLVLSARSAEGLRELAARHAAGLAQRPLHVQAAALARRRSAQPWRLSLVASDAAQAAEQLRRFSGEGHAARVEARQARRHKPVFVFAGQGSQWPGMGAGLLELSPAARAMVQRLAPVFAQESGGDLVGLLCDPAREAELARTDLAQPALVALQLALCAHLEACGLTPAAVVGHSIGEVTAACVAGAFTPEVALAIACRRGRAMQAAAGDGRMASFACSAAALDATIRQLGLPLDIAAENDGQSCVAGGPAAALEQLSAACAQQGIQVQPLRVEFAFHTRCMDEAAARLADGLGDFRCEAPRLPLYSTVTGAQLADASLDGAHWARGVRQCVRFADAVAAALRDDCTAFIGIAPQSVLQENIAALARAQGRTVLSFTSLRRRFGARVSLLELLGQCFTHGLLADLRGLHPEADAFEMPLTPWERKRCWPDMGRVRAGTPGAVAVAPQEAAPAVAPPPVLRLGERLRGLPAAERGAQLLGLLLEEVAALLGASAAQLSPDMPFMAMGVDSHMGVSLHARLQDMLGLELPATLIWNYVDISSLAGYLSGALEDPAAPPAHPLQDGPARDVPAPSSQAAPFDALSQLLDEIEAS